MRRSGADASVWLRIQPRDCKRSPLFQMPSRRLHRLKRLDEICRCRQERDFDALGNNRIVIEYTSRAAEGV
jgi:hypothetical protein